MRPLIHDMTIDGWSEWLGQKRQQGDRVLACSSCLWTAQNDVRPSCDQFGNYLLSILGLDTSVAQHGRTASLRFELVKLRTSVHQICKREWTPVARSMRIEIDDKRCVGRSSGTERGDNTQHGIKG
jgi:hypothetical protein